MSLKQSAENAIFDYPKDINNQPSTQGVADLFENVNQTFNTVALLLADLTMSYTAGAARFVATGDIVEAGGFRYIVLASGSTGDVATSAATPVQLDFIPNVPLSDEVNLRSAFKRSLVVQIPFTTAFIVANQAATAYPQAVAFSQSNNELYVLHSNSTSGSFISIWNLTTGAEKTVFRVSSGTGREALVYREHDAKRWLYAIGGATPHRIDITTLPTTGSTVTPSGADLFSAVTDALTQMGHDGKNFFYMEGSLQNPGGINSKHKFIIADNAFAPVGVVDFPISSVGSFGPYILDFPKAQGVTWHNGSYVFGMGGVYDTSGTPDDPDETYRQQGLMLCSPSGDVVTNALCDPDTAITLFGNMIGETLGVIENEGVFSDGDTLMAIWQTLTPAEFTGAEGLVRGIVITKELSTETNAIDFSGGARTPKINVDQREGLPLGFSGTQLKNPVTNTTLDDFDDILDMMTGLALDKYTFYGTNQTITDINAVAVDVAGAMVTFELAAAAGCTVTIQGVRSLRHYWVHTISGTRGQFDPIWSMSAAGDFLINFEDGDIVTDKSEGVMLRANGQSSFITDTTHAADFQRTGSVGFLQAFYDTARNLIGGIFQQAGDILFLPQSDVSWGIVSSDPEGVVTANVGSYRLDNSTGDLYIKTSGAGNTGWTFSSPRKGTFTPVLRDAATGGNVASTSEATGLWSRNGDVVDIDIQLENINTTGQTAGNEIFITGLPFNVASLTGSLRFMGSIRLNHLTYTGYVNPEILDNNQYIRLYDSISGAVSQVLLISAIGSGSADINLHLQYRTDAA